MAGFEIIFFFYNIKKKNTNRDTLVNNMYSCFWLAAQIAKEEKKDEKK